MSCLISGVLGVLVHQLRLIMEDSWDFGAKQCPWEAVPQKHTVKKYPSVKMTCLAEKTNHAESKNVEAHPTF